MFELKKTNLLIYVIPVSLVTLLSVPKMYYLAPAFFLVLGFFSLFARRIRIANNKIVIAFVIANLVLVVVNCGIFEYHGELFLHYGSLLPFLLAPFVLIGLLSVPIRESCIVSGCVMCAVGAAAISSFEVMGNGGGRAVGTLGNPISFGGLSLMIATMCGIAVHMKTRISHSRFFCVVGCVSGFLACVLAGSKGSWLAIPVALLSFLVSMRYFSNSVAHRRSLFSLFIGLAIAVMLSILAHPRFSETVFFWDHWPSYNVLKESLRNLNDGSVVPRFFIYQHAVDNFQFQNVAIGISRSEIAQLQKRDFGALFPGGYPTPAVHLHSDYLEILLHRGIVGLGTFAILLSVCLKIFFAGLKSQSSFARWAGLTGIALMLELSIFSLTATWMFNGARMAATTFLMLILLAVCIKANES